MPTAFLLQQTHSGQPVSTAQHHNDYHDAVNLVKVTANPQQTAGQCSNISKNITVELKVCAEF